VEGAAVAHVARRTSRPWNRAWCGPSADRDGTVRGCLAGEDALD
jgi:hypothetical protein